MKRSVPLVVFVQRVVSLMVSLTIGMLGIVQSGYADVTSPLVEYVDGTLIVSGEKFSRDLNAPEHALGTIIVVINGDDRALFEASLGRLGLRVLESFRSFPEVFVVSVPAGYETQWVAALAKQLAIRSVGVNRLARPT